MPHRPLRPLALVSLLAGCDYLLWNWSLAHGHDILALVAGMTLPPLLIALAWLLVVSCGRLLTQIVLRIRAGAYGRGARPAGATSSTGASPTAQAGAEGTPSPASSKLAA